MAKENEKKADENVIKTEHLLPASILISTLILSFTLLIIAGEMTSKAQGLVTAIENLEFKAELGGVPQADAPKPNPEPTPSTVVDPETLLDDDPVKGDATAPVTIVEFSDFQCPFCERFYRQTLPTLMKEYIDSGKVKLVYRDFPLSFHPYAQKAAEAAECADDQGKFWEMHNMIFENQNAIDVPDLKKYAGSLGLDQTTFDQCLDSGKYEQEVNNDIAAGTAAGVGGTPSFFVNGKLLVGAQPFEKFKPIIDAELGNA